MKTFRTTKKQKRALRLIASTYFKNRKGEPFYLTDGQCDIFGAVLKRTLKWVWISGPTRYGKTEVIALALMFLAGVENKKIPIVAGSEDKAKKIMEYVLQHLPDHPELYQGLLNVKHLKDVEKLKVTASKDTLRWADGGWIYVTSIDSRSISKEGEGVVGEGGDVVVLEEAGLIKRAEQFSKIVRMVEGDEGKLVMSGNCVEKSVFETAYRNPLYHKVRITLDQAVREGRYSQAELADKQAQTTAKDWKRYYLVEFPKASEFAFFRPKMYEELPRLRDEDGNPIVEVYGAVDPALGESAKGSLTGITILGRDQKGQVYEILSIGKKLTPDETINEILSLPYTFKRFGVERVQFQKYFLQTIDRKSKEVKRYIPFEGIDQSRKKEERIESTEPIVNTGIVLFKEGSVLWNHFADYPDTPLDVLDSFEMCCRLMGLTGKKRGVVAHTTSPHRL